ncbi:MAG: PAS domain S-box protein [Candidatus Obscuribacterales bacterium]|nr:PAS domain S-box protein [Candidatus Obscuribacterales bacterium]
MADKRLSHFHWYHLYYVLAAFDLLTVALSLSLNHQITERYNASIETHRAWTRRLKQLSELDRLAADVNAPGNDVFLSKNVGREKSRLEDALVRMEGKVSEIKIDFDTAGVTVTHPSFSKDLLRMNQLLESMVAKTTDVLTLFQEDRVEEAARGMASMDKSYYEANVLMRQVALQISEIQQAQLEGESRELEFLRSFERLFAMALGVMIVGVTAYGHNLATRIIQTTRERESHIKEIEDARKSLEAKTTELQSTLFELEKAQSSTFESERKLKAIFDHTFQFIGLLDADGILLEANRSALDFAAIAKDEVIGRPFWETAWWSHSSELQKLLRHSIASARDGQFVRFETTHKDRSGNLVAIDFSLSPIFDDNGNVVLIIPEGRDVSEKKQAEQRVSEFYSTVSHELRTPLAAIRGSLGLIGGGLAGPINEKVSQLVTIAISESERLIRLINDILDLRKIEAGMLELNKTGIESGAIVLRAIETLSPMASDKGVELVAEIVDSNTFMLDQDRITQVLTNLVSNAIKFSEGIADRVTVRVEPGDLDTVKFSVTDFGPGIPESKMDKLFGKFQQIDQADNRKKEGTGLGLAISKAIVEQHGGRIGVVSKVGEGSTFWFELPSQTA